MIEWLAAAFIVVAFAFLLVRLHVVAASRRVIQVSREAMAVVTDVALPDSEKERRMQAYTGRLLKEFLLILAGSVAAVAAPMAVVWGMQQAGWLSLDTVVDVTLSWQFLLAATLASVPLFLLFSRKG